MEITPPTAHMVEATSSDLYGSLDIFSAFYALARFFAVHHSCSPWSGRIIDPIYGVRVFDLRFVDARDEVLPVNANHHYAGPTRVCGMIGGKDIAGYPVGAQPAPHTGEIWLAPFPQCNLMLPVKLHFDNEFSGPVNVFVTGISGCGPAGQF
jgi:hypothetical protein